MCSRWPGFCLIFADRDNLKYSKLDFSFGKFGYKLVIVNTGKGHADLSQEYSEIPGEMKAVAKVLGVELLHETNVDALLAHCNEIDDDRAVLRALHFFGETTRVEDAADAIHHEDYKKFLELVNESGTSSWELLQNCYTMKDFHEQKITRTLALTQLFLKKNRCRCMPCSWRRFCRCYCSYRSGKRAG